MTISEWLNANLDSHGIYDASTIAADFLAATVSTLAAKDQPAVACWPTHTTKATAAMIADRGLGGEVHGTDAVAYGYEIAESLAERYVPNGKKLHRQLSGRGFRFRAAVSELVAAGL